MIFQNRGIFHLSREECSCTCEDELGTAITVTFAVFATSKMTNNSVLDWNGYNVYMEDGSMRSKICGIEIDHKGRELFCFFVSFMLLIDFPKINIPITQS